MTIALAVAEEITRLGNEKISLTRIARRVGVSRSTVTRVLLGQWRPAKPRDIAVKIDLRKRCPVCGAKCLVPCQACIARKALRMTKPDSPSDSDGLRIRLKGADRKRYEALRLAKQQGRRPRKRKAAMPDELEELSTF